MPLEVTRASITDLDALAPLFDGYRVFYQQPSDPPRARAFMEERLRNDDSVIFLARDTDTRDALGFTQLYASFSSVSTARIWILNDLFVSPTARTRGVGRALMDRATAHARESGAIRLELSTAKTNHTAQRLYEAIGYKRDEVFYRYLFSV
jgi:ribosomal protein S18 acetylase RimI-like enzyme